jgi:hypothetical protein
MTTFLALTVIPLAALVVVMLVAIWFTNFVAKRMVGRKHHLLESIVKTGQVPAAWQDPFARGRAGTDAAAHAATQSRARASYLARLNALIRYAETTPLVENEDAREVLLDRLDEVRAAWAAGRSLDS